MKYRTQAGVEVELSEEDLRKLRKTEEGKHTPEALFEKACRNIAHIADKKEDDVHDEKSIKEALGEIVRFGSSAEVGDAIFEIVLCLLNFPYLRSKILIYVDYPSQKQGKIRG